MKGGEKGVPFDGFIMRSIRLQVAAVIVPYFPRAFCRFFFFYFGSWYFHRNMSVNTPYATCIQYVVYILSIV